MNDITVAITTFRRQTVIDAIQSVEDLKHLSADRILIVDNDEAPSAQHSIDALRPNLTVPLDYHHVPGQNIAIARNACLERCTTRFLAFLDDDELAAPDWLHQLMHAWTQGVAAVFGPSIAVYPDDAPDWMRDLAPHTQRIAERGGEILSGHTANCLIDLHHPVMRAARFDLAFGRRGGSDRVFFAEAFTNGARYQRADDALVYEAVLPARQSLRWLLRRKFRIGEVLGATATARAKTLPLSLAKVGYCLAQYALNGFRPAARNAALLRATMHLGVAAGALGIRAGDYYGDTAQ